MSRPIQLHADFAIDPARSGGPSVLRDRLPPHGEPVRALHRPRSTFTSEALRQKWVASDAHTEVWGRLETFLVGHEYDFLLFDMI